MQALPHRLTRGLEETHILLAPALRTERAPPARTIAHERLNIPRGADEALRLPPAPAVLVDPGHDRAQPLPRAQAIHLGKWTPLYPCESDSGPHASVSMRDELDDVAVSAGDHGRRGDSRLVEVVHPPDLGTDRVERLISRTSEPQCPVTFRPHDSVSRVLAMADEFEAGGRVRRVARQCCQCELRFGGARCAQPLPVERQGRVVAVVR